MADKKQESKYSKQSLVESGPGLKANPIERLLSWA
jgi:hypothetical protein